MEPVNRLNQVVLLLRKQLADKSRRVTGNPTGTSATTETSSAAASDAADALSLSIAHQLDALRAAGVQDEHVLGRLLIEESLKAEFGDHLANDAAFQRVVDSVLECFEGDQALQATMRTVLGIKV